MHTSTRCAKDNVIEAGCVVTQRMGALCRDVTHDQRMIISG
jgi:hypothetical protein